MELKLIPRRMLVLFVAAGLALAVALAMTLSGPSANAAVTHHKQAAHHARHAHRTAPSRTIDAAGTNAQAGAQSGPNDTTGADNEPQASEGENTSGVDPDGPGGPDHQCPPTCAPGEQG
jgi:hypothetical protein